MTITFVESVTAEWNKYSAWDQLNIVRSNPGAVAKDAVPPVSLRLHVTSDHLTNDTNFAIKCQAFILKHI